MGEQEIKNALEVKSLEVSQGPWFDNLCELEKVEPTAVLAAASARIQRLNPEDNLYRLSENYLNAKNTLARRKKFPAASYFAAALPFGLAVATIALIIVKASAFYIGGGAYFFTLSLILPLLTRDSRNRREGLLEAPAEYTKATTDVDRGARSLLEQSVREVIRLHLVQPCDNVVKIGDGANLSSRVEPGQRIATRYRPAVELHMLRSGGAAIGVTGERGTGKSELLRSFCDTALGGATVKTGGTIGVFVSVPAAFQGAQFLALVAEQLARAVPGYRTSEERRKQRRFRLAIPALIVGLALAFFSLFIFDGQLSHWRLTDSELGGFILALGGIVASASYMIIATALVERFIVGSDRQEALLRKWTISRNPGRTMASVRPSGSASARSSLGRDAERLMLRLRYAETVTLQSEGSVSGGGAGFKLGGQRTLSSLPLTEASLISEIKTLSDRLGKAGYRIIVGIDEMDKLEAGQATEDFLNSIKQLFAISSCSFLVSVSSSAWARFVQRGVNVRDALDSSLDAVEPIGALDFLETRSLILHRREAMSDSEILFCYVLAGGFPREVMRCAQSLAIRNRDAEGSSQTLDVLGRRVLNMELHRLIEASKHAMSGWEFHDRDKMFRQFDHLFEHWEAIADTSAAASSITRNTYATLISNQGKSEGEIILLQLELMVEFFNAIRQLFCLPKKKQVTVAPTELADAPDPSMESSVVGGSSQELDAANASSPKLCGANTWRSDVLQICDTLAEVRRLIESDPTSALQHLSRTMEKLGERVGTDRK